jgi:hypothetical protein
MKENTPKYRYKLTLKCNIYPNCGIELRAYPGSNMTTEVFYNSSTHNSSVHFKADTQRSY